MLKSPLSAHPVIEALEARIAPATFTVTTTADSGPGSLRQAILDANALEGADTIGFAFEGDQLQVIALTSSLPAIVDKVTISAYKSPALDTWQVRLDGTNAGLDTVGLTISTAAANGTVIQALQIANFGGSGVLIDGSVGVEISGNVIFGNGLHGIHIKGGNSTKVYSNSLGASPSYPDSTGNKGDGLLIENSSSNLVGIPYLLLHFYSDAQFYSEGNGVNANGLFGIEIRGGSDNVVAGNTIAGNGNLASASDQGGGIAVIDASRTHIGGPYLSGSIPFEGPFPNTRMLGNEISANSGNGVLVKGQGSVYTRIAGNDISGNLLGDGVRIDGAVSTSLVDSETYFSVRGSFFTMKGNTIPRMLAGV